MQTDHYEIDPPTEDATGANRVLDAAFAFWRAALLLSADELGLFAALANGAPDAPTVGARLGIAGEAAADLLDALAQLGFVERRGDGFSNAAIAIRFLDPASPAYLGRWLTMARATMHETTDLTERLRASGVRNAGDTPPMAAMWAEIAAILETDHV